MPTAIAEPPEQIHVSVPRQFRRFPPGEFLWDIGFAHEAIVAGWAKLKPQSEKKYADFVKSLNAGVAREAAKVEAGRKELAALKASRIALALRGYKK